MSPVQHFDTKTATTKEILQEIRALRKAFNKDISSAAKIIPEREVRYLVDMYYTAQNMRVGVEGKLRSIGEEPNAMLVIFLDMFAEVEKDIQAALDAYTYNSDIGRKFREIKGIGPVLTAGWLAHVSVHKADMPSKVLSFGGYNPNMKWEKGQKRPYNAGLKLIFTKMGRAFVFLSNRNSFFGQKYKDYAAMITAKNDRGEFADRCAELLATRNYKKTTIAYQHYVKGRYPKAHINASARMKTVALCVAILHREHYRQVFDKFPPLPYGVLMQNDENGSPIAPRADMSAPVGHHNLIDIEDVLLWEKTALPLTKKQKEEAIEDDNLSDAPLPAPEDDDEE